MRCMETCILFSVEFIQVLYHVGHMPLSWVRIYFAIECTCSFCVRTSLGYEIIHELL